MSRAFMKERDDVPEPQILIRDPAEPQLMTASGLEQLHAKRVGAVTPMERLRIDNAIAAAVVVEPPLDTSIVAFGATVRVNGAAAKERTYTFVGTDEADVGAGRVSVHSPLADALMGARVGDRVTWSRPAGDRTLTILEVRYR
jgi:transcription elongation factor GreB